jgi:hypothetical protein
VGKTWPNSQQTFIYFQKGRNDVGGIDNAFVLQIKGRSWKSLHDWVFGKKGN